MFLAKKKIPKSYILVDTVKKLSWLRSVLLEAEEFAFDIETNHPTKKNDKLPPGFVEMVCGISFAWGYRPSKKWRPGNAAYIPLTTADDSLFWGARQEAVLSVITEILQAPVLKIAHNGKFDCRKLFELNGIDVRYFEFDTMLAASLVDEDRAISSHALKSDFDDSGKVIKLGMSDAYLDTSASMFKDDLNQAKKFYDEQYHRYSRVPLETLYPYGCADADLTLALKYIMQERLEAEGLTWLFEVLVMPLQHELMRVEMHGVPVDLETAVRAKAEQEELSSQLEYQIYELVGKKFDIGSGVQLGRLLYEEMRLPGHKNKQGRWVTDADALKKLDHPVAQALLKWKRSQKILTSYLVPILANVRESDGRIGWIHPNFYMGTKTGRLTMSDPTLNVLPRPENGGDVVKSVFAGHEDYRFIFMDFSQIELRVIAHLSQEPVWVDGFRNGYDMHAAMAQRIWHPDLSVDEVKKNHAPSRSKAKAVNFGIAYGMTVYSLSERLGITVDEAEHLVNEEYFGTAPVLRDWIEAMHRHAEDYGYVSSMFGRRRHLPDAQIQVPYGPMWPAEPHPCYRNGPNLEGLGIPWDDLLKIKHVDLRTKIYAGPQFLHRCADCNQLITCIAHREVKRLKGKKNAAFRQAVNAPVQSSAVDMTSLCMVLINKELVRQNLDAQLVMHTHDELQAYAHVSAVENTSRVMKYYMTEYMHELTQFSIPLKVDAVVCHRWSDKYDEE